MEAPKINVFIASFRGLGLAKTQNLICAEDTTSSDLLTSLAQLLPPLKNVRYIVTTAGGRVIKHDAFPIVKLLPLTGSNWLNLRLSVPLCGGKGGFGSQLRAAGGRMSSKRKKTQGENNGSNRNLDGRRLRTVNEAKALAEYLALKPEMERKEKEERRKRWQQVLDVAEKSHTDMRNNPKGKLDGSWVEDRDEASDRTREAVHAAIESGCYRDNLPIDSFSGTEAPNMTTSDSATYTRTVQMSTTSRATNATHPPAAPRTFVGFDDDEEGFMSDSESETPPRSHQ